MDRNVIYYKTAENKCFIEEFIDSQNPKVQQKILWTLRLLRELDRLRKPYFEYITDSNGIWETRIKVGSDIFRIFFFFDKGNVVVLTHGFVKKTQKTPPDQIKRAEELKADFLRRNNTK
jgi:phage-related protein